MRFIAKSAQLKGGPPPRRMLSGVLAIAVLSIALQPAPAQAARTTSVRDEGSLRFASDEATLIVDEGRLSGTLPGSGRVYFTYNGSPNVSARFTIHTAGGTVDGTAKCRLNNPNSPTPSFRGALVIAGGSGRYAHARGSGELFGVFHRRGYGLVVQAIGRLSY
ncbi:MAG TPA: hypothetical protein VGP18_12020 [Solirubrobacteraceae bacterium]|jgi:hypothetical protein|nr:hypothetical protein [Solirubrobacteraceae bacterium]